MSALSHDSNPDDRQVRELVATQEEGERRRSDPAFMDAMNEVLAFLDSQPPAPLMTGAEFLRRYPNKP